MALAAKQYRTWDVANSNYHAFSDGLLQGYIKLPKDIKGVPQAILPLAELTPSTQKTITDDFHITSVKVDHSDAMVEATYSGNLCKNTNVTITYDSEKINTIATSCISENDSIIYTPEHINTTNGSYSISSSGYWTYNSKTNLKEEIKSVMKSNLLIKMETRQLRYNNQISTAEQKARNTLRDLISEKDWRRYLTNGFVMVQGKSGKWYQIFKNQKHTKVFYKGKLTDEICIHTEGGCPPTDHILNIMLLLNMDEEAVWNLGNVYKKAINNIKVMNSVTPKRNLLETFKFLKKEIA